MYMDKVLSEEIVKKGRQLMRRMRISWVGIFWVRIFHRGGGFQGKFDGWEFAGWEFFWG